MNLRWKEYDKIAIQVAKKKYTKDKFVTSKSYVKTLMKDLEIKKS